MKLSFRFLQNSWDASRANALDPLGKLIYRSHLLGCDPQITNSGGGNTSAKLTERDPVTGETAEVLWVKGSGGDLRTAKKEHFASLYQQKLLGLQKVYSCAEKKGPKSEIEDRMVGMYAHCVFNLNFRAPSIDTPLHAFIFAKHVDHTHPNAVIAIAATRNSETLTKKIYGEEVLWTPWQRPGFDLGLKLKELSQNSSSAKGIVLGQHGLINWAEDDQSCYLLSLRLIERAAQFIAQQNQGERTFGGQKYPSISFLDRQKTWVTLLPWLRGQLSQENRVIATIQDDEATLRFVNSADAPRLAELGTSCPDHFLRTKIKPLFVDWNPQDSNLSMLKGKLIEGLEKYRQDYADYYHRHKRPDSPPMRNSNPTVILIPGLGMVAWGKDKSESRVTAEFYRCTIDVMHGAEALDEYAALPLQEAFDIEYWSLEEAKLRRMPPEKELARQVICLIGAGSGIGRASALRLAKEGAHLVCADLSEEKSQNTSKEINDHSGPTIGVAGSGISKCDFSIGLTVDITQRSSIRAMLDSIILAYGGLDGIVITAGVFVPPDLKSEIPDEKWAFTFAVNVTGSYVVASEAAKLWREQGIKANLILTTSANAVVAKKGSIAYDTSKAAANHLVRELAIELSPLVRVNAVAPATVVQESEMFSRARVIASLAKYEIPYSEQEKDSELTTKLANYYAQRNLTKESITTADQAEAIFLFLSRLTKTTGQVLAVDGGLHEAFLR